MENQINPEAVKAILEQYKHWQKYELGEVQTALEGMESMKETNGGAWPESLESFRVIRVKYYKLMAATATRAEFIKDLESLIK